MHPIRPCVSTCVYACACTCAYTCSRHLHMHLSTLACDVSFLCVCVPCLHSCHACMLACMLGHKHSYMYACACACTHMHLYAFMHACTLACPHAATHPHTHAPMHPRGMQHIGMHVHVHACMMQRHTCMQPCIILTSMASRLS